MKEVELSKLILDWLNYEGKHFAIKHHASMLTSRGVPDIIACVDGRFVGFEVKLPGKEHTLKTHQKHMAKRIETANGLSYMVTSLEEVQSIVGEIYERKESNASQC